MAKNKEVSFAGADDVYLTKNSIAIRKVNTYQKSNGSLNVVDKTRYVPKTKRNLNKAKSIFGYIRFGRG